MFAIRLPQQSKIQKPWLFCKVGITIADVRRKNDCSKGLSAVYNFLNNAILITVGCSICLCSGTQILNAQASDICNHPLHRNALCDFEPVMDAPLTYSENELYYSGGILHQAKISSPSVTLKSKNTMHQIEQLNADPTEHAKESENNLDQRSDNIGLYNIFKNEFYKLSKAKKKKIQLCLKRSEPSLQIDGVWGDRTFEALMNVEGFEKKRASGGKQNVFSIFKSVFKRDKSCNTLISKFLKPSKS